MLTFRHFFLFNLQEAMRKAEAAGNKQCPVKIKLVAPPLYVLNTQTLDKVIRNFCINSPLTYSDIIVSHICNIQSHVTTVLYLVYLFFGELFRI